MTVSLQLFFSMNITVTLLYYAYIFLTQVLVQILKHYCRCFCCCAAKYISCGSKIFVITSHLNITFNKILITFNKILITFNTAILLYYGKCSFCLLVDRTGYSNLGVGNYFSEWASYR